MRRHGKVMSVDSDPHSSTPVGLPFFSFLSRLPADLAAKSPPPRIQASVPFKWEEAPGKPKISSTSFSRSRASLNLKLPPRLYGEDETRLTRMDSSSTVLDGTYTDFSLPSFGSFSSECWSLVDVDVDVDQKQQPRASSFGSWAAMVAFCGNKRNDQEEMDFVQDFDGGNDKFDSMIRIHKGRRRWRFVYLFQRKFKFSPIQV